MLTTNLKKKKDDGKQPSGGGGGGGGDDDDPDGGGDGPGDGSDAPSTMDSDLTESQPSTTDSPKAKKKDRIQLTFTEYQKIALLLVRHLRSQETDDNSGEAFFFFACIYYWPRKL